MTSQWHLESSNIEKEIQIFNNYVIFCVTQKWCRTTKMLYTYFGNNNLLYINIFLQSVPMLWSGLSYFYMNVLFNIALLTSLWPYYRFALCILASLLILQHYIHWNITFYTYGLSLLMSHLQKKYKNKNCKILWWCLGKALKIIANNGTNNVKKGLSGNVLITTETFIITCITCKPNQRDLVIVVLL